jgi:hypothetical protein
MIERPVAFIGAPEDEPIVRLIFYRTTVRRVTVVEKPGTKWVSGTDGNPGHSVPSGERVFSEDEQYQPIYTCETDELPKFMRI